MEIWKDIVGYEQVYQVSNLGRVKSLNYNHTGKERLLTLIEDSHGYYVVNLWKNKKQKQCKVHRLIGEAFIPNPTNLPYINHIDETPKNNNVSNLEWCDAKYNVNYGCSIPKRSSKKSKPVLCIELNKQYNSLKEAGEDLGVSAAAISQVCHGKHHTTGGYHFQFV